MGSIGYFELLRFDPRDVAGWRARASPLAETGFDAIEVFNGDHYAEIPEVERVMRDWYALLDAGVHITATGNSDSHKLTLPRVRRAPEIVRRRRRRPRRTGSTSRRSRSSHAVRAGHVVVSSGALRAHRRRTARDRATTRPAGRRVRCT